MADDKGRAAPETGASTEQVVDPQAHLLLDHNYDGIQEYDNPMPRWWVLLFWGTFLFAVGYFFHYQLSPNGKSIQDEYAAELDIAAAEAEKRALAEQVTEATLADLLTQKPMVLAGQAVFQQRCVTCHDAAGQGKIGPNLTDDFWIHGGNLMDIHKTVHDGVIEKGMQAWGKTLKPIELRQVVVYVGSLRGTNVPGKAPQGQRFVLGQAGGVASAAPGGSALPSGSAAPGGSALPPGSAAPLGSAAPPGSAPPSAAPVAPTPPPPAPAPPAASGGAR